MVGVPGSESTSGSGASPPWTPPPVSQQSGSPKTLLIVIGALIILALGTIALAGSLTGEDEGSAPLVSSTVAVPASTTAQATPTSTAPPTAGLGDGRPIADLAEAVVLIMTIDEQGEAITGGSGSIVDPSGLILTNAHVVEQVPAATYTSLLIGLTTDPAEPPEPQFKGTVVAFDAALDLAMVQITADANDNPVTPRALPTVEIGDSDTVDLGDRIRILGYPGIGGDTITLTSGSVSGYTSQAGVGNRAWIKTDATRAGGNSGGLAFDDAGQLVGVPTLASAGGTSSVSDCRFVEDTNGDNMIDERDSCIPIGGFINGIRPINLALDIIDIGRLREPVEPDIEQVPAEAVIDASFDNVRFSSGVTDDDQPVDEIVALPSTGTQLCVFWDYDGMVDRVRWDALWSIDGELEEDISFIDEEWIGGVSGSWWVCADTGDLPALPSGEYEISLLVNGNLLASNSIVVGDVPVGEVTVVNNSDQTVCFLQLSLAVAGGWGPDDLGESDVIPPGGSATITVPAGTYDLLARTCDLDVIAELTGFDLTVGSVVELD